ncbi:MAG: hypothetical protein AAF004_10195 [Pseudomonadota bacterium]
MSHDTQTPETLHSDVAKALRELPDIVPDEVRIARWTKSATSHIEPARSRRHWLLAAIAASVLVGVLAARFVAVPASITVDDAVAETPELPTNDRSDVIDLPTYVAQTAVLEQMLSQLPSEGRVRSVSQASAIVSLEDRLARINNVIENSTSEISSSAQQQLWRERVGVMNTLVSLKQGDTSTVWL